MITLKIAHGEQSDEFLDWLSWVHVECVRNGGEPFNFRRYIGDTVAGADMYELWGNSGVVTYAKTKWG
jgi:hypothetical protein